jgi:hypothetical protein
MVPLDSIPPGQFSAAPIAAGAAVERYGHPGPRTLHYAGLLDVLGTGAQCVCPPTLHGSGEPRQWGGGRPGEPSTVPYPALLGAVKALLTACGHKPKTATVTPALVPLLDRDEGLFAGVDLRLRKRIEHYLEACPPAVSGEGGHGRTFAVACALVWGFALESETALRFLAERYNPRCSPPWSIDELRRKIDGAANALDHRNPRGHLLHPGPRLRLSPRPIPFPTTQVEEVSKWLR